MFEYEIIELYRLIVYYSYEYIVPPPRLAYYLAKYYSLIEQQRLDIYKEVFLIPNIIIDLENIAKLKPPPADPLIRYLQAP